MSRKLPVFALIVATLLTSSCWKTKQQLYTNVVNDSQITLRSIEVDYPGGTYGIPELKPGASQKKWGFVTPPCRYALRFIDEQGKLHSSKAIELGKEKCPTGVLLKVDGSLNVTGTTQE